MKEGIGNRFSGLSACDALQRLPYLLRSFIEYVFRR